MTLAADWSCYKDKLSVRVFKLFLEQAGISDMFPKCKDGNEKAIKAQVALINGKIDIVIGGGDLAVFIAEQKVIHVGARTVSSAGFQTFVSVAAGEIDKESGIKDKAGLKTALKSLNFT